MLSTTNLRCSVWTVSDLDLVFQKNINKQKAETINDDCDQSNDLGYELERPLPDQDTTFRDKKTKIDYILAYEDSISVICGSETDEHMITRKKKQEKHKLYRERFFANLQKAGLMLEEEVLSQSDNIDEESSNRKVKSTHFIKISTPWPVLCSYAEKLNQRAPLEVVCEDSTSDWSHKIFKLLRINNPFYECVPNKPLNYHTCTFTESNIDKFLGSDNEEEYFNKTQRIRIVYEILQSTVYGKRKKGQIGVDSMVQENILTAAFPLHDGNYEGFSNTPIPSIYNKRQVLYDYWAKWSKWYKYQPLDHIRDYFGEKIAMYFAWLGFYTAWLIPAAIVGLLVFLYGIFTVHQDIPAKEVCESGNKFKMCKNCDEDGCLYWYLSEDCFFAKLSYLFDQSGTVFYSIFVSFWEHWKRKNARLAYRWDCTYFEEEEERPRPEFALRAPKIKRNPITGMPEPSFPKDIRYQRMAAGLALIALMIIVVIIFLIAVIIYRVVISIPLFKSHSFKVFASILVGTTGALINIILIIIFGHIYETLALRLTQWEMHRTQTEFDNHLTFKVFIFHFVNYYASIFYVAFFKERFNGPPNNYSFLLGVRSEECIQSGCLIELAQQLMIIILSKQFINITQEIIFPKIKSWWNRRKSFIINTKEKLTRWEQDYHLLSYQGLFDEYLEMVLQFGFITIFVPAFPLAPLLALLNNWVEIRLDAQKLVCMTRRPNPERAQNIGIWFSILTFIAHIAVITNAFLIAFTSNFLPKLLYQLEHKFSLENYIDFSLAWAPVNSTTEACRYKDFRDENGKLTPFYWKLMFARFVFVCIFEHVVFFVCQMIRTLVPDVPKSLENQIKRERYLAKQALADSNKMFKLSSSKFDTEEDEDPSYM